MPQINYLYAMNKNVLFTILLFFLPVLQKFITIEQFQIIVANLLFDFIFFSIIVTVLLTILISSIIFFFYVTNRWIQSNYKSDKLLHSIISSIVIIGLYFTIKTIINRKMKRLQNSFQNLPNLLLKGIPKII